VVQNLSQAEQHYESIKERMESMKYEYRKNFVDINFYGMQSKVQNPMSNPEWRDTFPKENAEKENNLRKLEEAKT